MVVSISARHRFLLAIIVLASAAMVGVTSPVARAQTWEPAGPVATSSGMTAVATDPDNPKVVWLGSATSLWVSEDEGQSFHLVLQMSRLSGQVRETGSQPIDDDEDEGEVGAPNLNEPGDDDDDEEDGITVDTGDDRGREGEDDGENIGEDDGTEQRFGVVRIRVYGDVVYACTSRGLFSVARAARRMGTEREIRFGRKIAANDVAVTPDGRVWVATDNGLYQIGTDGIGRAARGLEEDLQVRGLVISDGRLVAATSRGLRIASRSVDGYDRLAVGGREDNGLYDVLADGEGSLLVAGAGLVARISTKAGEVPIVEESTKVPGAARLAQGREGARWAVGAKGAWRWKADEGWQRVTEGLFDRRLLDVAPGFGGVAELWAVGRSGAWRLVADASGSYGASAKRLAEVALAGWPSADEVRSWATKSRGVNMDEVDAWAIEERLSWLLPTVQLRWRWNRMRNEDYQYIPTIDTRILDAVQVRPRDDDFLVLAVWDLMPALTVALEGTRTNLETTRIRARKQLDQVRDVVLPIYQNWARKRIELATASGERTVRETVKDLLTLQRLEADLHVYTGGRFPIDGATKNAPKAAPTQSEAPGEGPSPAASNGPSAAMSSVGRLFDLPRLSGD
jgi:hypothetical protein